MKEIEYSSNLVVQIPKCCGTNSFKVAFFEKEMDTMIAAVKATHVGKNLFQEIGEGAHVIKISTHSKEHGCHLVTNFLCLHVEDFESSREMGKGSSSTIFVPCHFGVERSTSNLTSWSWTHKNDRFDPFSSKNLHEVFFYQLLQARYLQQGQFGNFNFTMALISERMKLFMEQDGKDRVDQDVWHWKDCSLKNDDEFYA